MVINNFYIEIYLQLSLQVVSEKRPKGIVSTYNYLGDFIYFSV